MYRDQGRNPETTLVFSPDFGAGALGCNHYYGEILTNLSALFDNVESMRIAENRALFHQGNDGVDHVTVLFVRRQVHDNISLRQEFFVTADIEVVFNGIFI